MEPGQTFNPGQQSEPQSEPAPQPSSAQPPPPQAQPNESVPMPPAPQPQAAAPGEPAWQFNEEADTYTGEEALPSQTTPTVSWTASEYVAHDKNAGWYLLVVLAAAVVAAFVFLITRDKISPIVVVVLGIAFAIFGARKPQVLEYAVDSSGIHVGQKHYPYGLFRTFSIIEEDAVRSILLMPLQRFNLPISIYYDPADEQKIVEALSVNLPHEERQVGQIDNLMRKIRF